MIEVQATSVWARNGVCKERSEGAVENLKTAKAPERLGAFEVVETMLKLVTAVMSGAFPATLYAQAEAEGTRSMSVIAQ